MVSLPNINKNLGDKINTIGVISKYVGKLETLNSDSSFWS